MATTHEGAGTWQTSDTSDTSDRLRLSKQHSSKGIGIITAMIAFSFVWMAITFWTASFIAPEPEESTGWAHDERGRPTHPAPTDQSSK